MTDLERRHLIAAAAGLTMGLGAIGPSAGKDRGHGRNQSSAMDISQLPFADLPPQGSINDRPSAD